MTAPMIDETHIVKISKQKTNPTISIDVTATDIGVSISLADFLVALSTVYGGVATTLTQKQHLAKLQTAAQSVTDDMKRQTVGHV